MPRYGAQDRSGEHWEGRLQVHRCVLGDPEGSLGIWRTPGHLWVWWGCGGFPSRARREGLMGVGGVSEGSGMVGGGSQQGGGARRV